MSMATHPAFTACPPGDHRHTPAPKRTAVCAFPDARHTDGLCGREPVAVYVHPTARPRNTYRCARHDRDIVVQAAADLGFKRIEVKP